MHRVDGKKRKGESKKDRMTRGAAEQELKNEEERRSSKADRGKGKGAQRNIKPIQLPKHAFAHTQKHSDRKAMSEA